MKKITLNLLKGLLVIVLFTGVSVVLSTNGVQAVSEANAKVIGGDHREDPRALHEALGDPAAMDDRGPHRLPEGDREHHDREHGGEPE
ncbi:MAG TPA: hypothetical protein VLB84_19330, partial [Bacteroidia bacterium]|nr:hypothetical protein [Bacteroidia bacterium]